MTPTEQVLKDASVWLESVKGRMDPQTKLIRALTEALTEQHKRVLELDPWAGIPPYDPKFGDDKICGCDHPYYRHFDSYDDMKPVGCKYCPCQIFVGSE